MHTEIRNDCCELVGTFSGHTSLTTHLIKGLIKTKYLSAVSTLYFK